MRTVMRNFLGCRRERTTDRRTDSHSRSATLTNRLEAALLDFQRTLTLANRYRGERRLRGLGHADGLLDDTRFMVRFATDLGYLSARPYEFANKQLAELGRLLGGWRNVTKKR